MLIQHYLAGEQTSDKSEDWAGCGPESLAGNVADCGLARGTEYELKPFSQSFYWCAQEALDGWSEPEVGGFSFQLLPNRRQTLVEDRSAPICRPAYRDLMTESGQKNRILGCFCQPSVVLFYIHFI